MTRERPSLDDETSSGGGPPRLMSTVASIRSSANRPAVRRLLLVGFGALFLVMSVSAFTRLPDDLVAGDLWLLVPLAAITAPITLALNAIEFQVMGRAVGGCPTLRAALRVTLVASVANYLPAPGGVAVRTAALVETGTRMRSALMINGIAATAWFGVAGLFAGLALWASGDGLLIGIGLLGGGLLILLIAARTSRARLAAENGDWYLGLVVTEVLIVATSAVRVYLSLRVVGISPTAAEAVVISASTVISALIGIAPAGLGIRESLAGFLAATLDVPVSAAIAAAAVDRAAAQVGVAITWLIAMRGVRLSSDPTTGGARSPAQSSEVGEGLGGG